MSDSILCGIKDHIAQVTINHPQRRNAMSYAMWCALGDTLENLTEDGHTRVLILSGAGNHAFSAGNDISEFGRWRQSPEKLAIYHQASDRVLSLLRQAPFPVIAGICGACVGAGCEMALACDFRYVAQNARFAITAVKLGLGYKFEDVKQVVAVLGENAARKMLLTGRMYNAIEARELGLADAVFDPATLDEGIEVFAAELAANAPLTQRALKAALFEASRPVAEQDRERVQRLVDDCHASADYQEGRNAFAEKRRAEFKGR